MKMKILLAISVFVFGASASLAAGACTGCKIKMLGSGPYFGAICTSGDCIYIDIEQTVTGKPACSSNSAWDFVLDTSTAQGRSTYAMVLTAYAAGQAVNITGTNFCSLSPSGVTENIYYITISP